MKYRFILLVVSSFLLLLSQTSAQSYFPETGPDAIYQKSLDLKSDLNVLMISLQPGYEDLAALAYFRMGKGARILSAYVTNGDATENDVREAYPHERAAIHREEAFTALRSLGGQVYFLNMMDLPVARDSAKARSLWVSDTVQFRMMKLISDFKPDLILVSRDWTAGGKSLRWKLMVDDVLEAVKALQPVRPSKAPGKPAPYAPWQVGRVMVDEGDGKGVSVGVSSQHPRHKKTYRTIGDEAARSYRSLMYQRDLWMKSAVPSYKVIFPATRDKITSVDQNLPQPISQQYRSAQGEVRTLASQVGKIVAKGMPPVTRQRAMLSKLVAVMDRIDFAIARLGVANAMDRKILLHWKGDLEDLRCALLDVNVHYKLYDSVFTNLQLGYLVVDSVSGPKGGTTEIFFPGIDQGWIVNESLQKYFNAAKDTQFRLLSPKNLDYNFPHETYGLAQTGYGKPFTFFILHKEPKREATFIKKVVLSFFYTPRFVIEVQTPIVRAVENERVAVRLINNSRDGVRDQISVKDSAVTSTVGAFRLNTKGGVHLDTLILRWQRPLQEGTYMFPLSIGSEEVGQFGARKFEAEVDTSKTIGLLSPFTSTSTTEALRRLGALWNRVSLDSTFEPQLTLVSTLIIDHRALTFLPLLKERKEALRKFVEKGGRLLILSQDVEAWNQHPLWDGLSLTRTQALDEEVAVAYDSTSRYLRTPNALSQQEWNNWIFERASQYVGGEAVKRGRVVIQSEKEGLPLLLEIPEGSGEVLYVALSLHHQLINIHPGTLRLLANLVGY